MSAPDNELAAVGEQFDSLETQERSARARHVGLPGSEILLFAALFALYAAYRSMYLPDFKAGIEHNTLAFGTINTYVLLTSSLLAALSVSAVRADRAAFGELAAGGHGGARRRPSS